MDLTYILIVGVFLILSVFSSIISFRIGEVKGRVEALKEAMENVKKLSGMAKRFNKKEVILDNETKN